LVPSLFERPALTSSVNYSDYVIPPASMPQKTTARRLPNCAEFAPNTRQNARTAISTG